MFLWKKYLYCTQAFWNSLHSTSSVEGFDCSYKKHINVLSFPEGLLLLKSKLYGLSFISHITSLSSLCCYNNTWFNLMKFVDKKALVSSFFFIFFFFFYEWNFFSSHRPIVLSLSNLYVVCLTYYSIKKKTWEAI